MKIRIKLIPRLSKQKGLLCQFAFDTYFFLAMVCLCQRSDVPLSNLDLPSKGLQNQAIQENTGNNVTVKTGLLLGIDALAIIFR